MSRDEAMIREAIESPYHAVPYRTGFLWISCEPYREWMQRKIWSGFRKRFRFFRYPAIWIRSGIFGEGVKELFALYRQHGIKNASFILYRDGRHEMLRETNRQEVFRDIIRWLDSRTV